MDLNSLEDAIKKSWSKDTCYPGCANDWTPENPAFGQCAVTALVVQDYFGGDLLFCKEQFHFWNRISNGKEIDFSRSQFPSGTIISVDKVESREYVLHSQDALDAKTLSRYNLLKSRVEKKLNF